MYTYIYISIKINLLQISADKIEKLVQNTDLFEFENITILPFIIFSGYETKTHDSSHRLKPKRVSDSSTFMDSDYLGFMPGGACTGYNYLDPNYMPAS